MTGTGPQADRFIGRLAGRYILKARRTSSGLDLFACRTQSVSVERLVLSAPLAGMSGDAVSANIEQLGLIEAHIERPIKGGFSALVCPKTTDLAILRRRIDWLRRWGAARAQDQRAHKRFMPMNSSTRLVLGDGSRVHCHIIDVSSAGVALSADLLPQLGEPMAVGSIVGRVARLFECGFAIQFLEKVSAEQLEARLRPPDEHI